MLYRCLRRSGLPVAFTEGEHPQLRVSFSPALPVGVESSAEILDVWFYERVDPERACAQLAETFPTGLAIVSADRVPLPFPSPEAGIQWVEYEVDLPGETLDVPHGAEFPPSVELQTAAGSAGLRFKVRKDSGSLVSPYKVLGQPLSRCRPANHGPPCKKNKNRIFLNPRG